MAVKIRKQYSNKTKSAVFTVLVLGITVSVVGISSFAWQKTNAPADQAQAVLSATDTLQSSDTQQTAVLGEQTQPTTASYVIGVTSITQNSGTLRVAVTITNESKETLQTSPFIQFKLVSLSSSVAHNPIQQAGVMMYGGGPLAAGQTNSGTLVFEPFATNEQFELRFYTDPAATNEYIVVPLIAATR